MIRALAGNFGRTDDFPPRAIIRPIISETRDLRLQTLLRGPSRIYTLKRTPTRGRTRQRFASIVSPEHRPRFHALIADGNRPILHRCRRFRGRCSLSDSPALQISADFLPAYVAALLADARIAILSMPVAAVVITSVHFIHLIGAEGVFHPCFENSRASADGLEVQRQVDFGIFVRHRVSGVYPGVTICSDLIILIPASLLR